MKAILTVERYAPEVGGAQRVVQQVAEGLAERGHDVTVMTSGRRSSETRGGVCVERLPLRGNAKSRIRGDRRLPLSMIRTAAPDVVLNYAAQTWTSDVCASLLDEPERPAVVLAPCGFSALGTPGWESYFEDLRETLPRYDALIFHSRHYRDWDFAGDAGAENRHVVPNGADPPRREGRAGEMGISEAAVVLTVGSHVRSKGHRDFIRAVRMVRRGREARGLIVAPARRGLDAIRGCHLRCRAMAAVPGTGLEVVEGDDRPTVERALASADVLLLPSAVECSPLVILEAMAAGLPWISYDVGNVRELAGGIVVDGLEALAATATEVLSGQHPGLGKEGRALWERRHRWEQIVPRYEEVLERAVESRRATARSVSFAARPD